MTAQPLDAIDNVYYFENNDKVQDYELQNTVNNILQTDLTGYFPIVPCVCNGVTFLQSGTSNSFTWSGGTIRWADQVLGFNQTGIPVTTEQPAFAKITATTGTIVYSASGGQQYIVAKLTSTVTIAHNNSPSPQNTQVATLSGEVLLTTKNMTQINADATLVPLQTIDVDAGVYKIGVDANCIYRYGQILEPQISAPVEITTSTTLTQTLNNVIATGGANINVNMPLVATLTQPYPHVVIANSSAKPISVNGNSSQLSPTSYFAYIDVGSTAIFNYYMSVNRWVLQGTLKGVIGDIMYIDTGDAHQLNPSLVGWHNCGGETIVNCITLYPDYWAYIGLINPSNTDHTTTIGRPYKLNATDAVVPNLAGVFLRAFGAMDPHHASYEQSRIQPDQNLSHTHALNQNPAYPIVIAPGLGSGGTRAVSDLALAILPDGGSEARPFNVAYEVFTRIAYSI